jgi:hypothetical protein
VPSNREDGGLTAIKNQPTDGRTVPPVYSAQPEEGKDRSPFFGLQSAFLYIHADQQDHTDNEKQGQGQDRDPVGTAQIDQQGEDQGP